MNPQEPRMLNAMSVDVEDYFQVSAFDGVIDRADWDNHACRVERNTDDLLDLFAGHDTCATFFILGWVAERYPELVQRIHAAGHEIASHGYEHRRVNTMTPDEFRLDLRRAKAEIESAAPVTVRGFRAPSFSIDGDTLWAHDVLREEGYHYSSSVFPVRHDRYGIPSFPRAPVKLEGANGRSLWEFPMTTLRVLGRNIPAAGGGWLRVLPLALFHRAIRTANAAGTPAVVYTHPWEIDPDQPRVAGTSRAARFRHYVNLRRTRARLDHLLSRHEFGSLAQVLAGLERGAVPRSLTDSEVT